MASPIQRWAKCQVQLPELNSIFSRILGRNILSLCHQAVEEKMVSLECYVQLVEKKCLINLVKITEDQ